MAEANLARSLFSGSGTPPSRKKQAERPPTVPDDTEGSVEAAEAAPVLPPTDAMAELQAELAAAQVQIAALESFRRQRDELEADLLKCLSHADEWQVQVRSLEQRNQDLETQLQELQELILQQSSQRSEFETAINHWKEQSVRHQHHALQLSGALERLLSQQEERKRQSPESPSSCQSVEERNSHLTHPPRLRTREEELPVAPVKSSVDLPAFLVRSRQF
ncbi:MAG: hypothetical protein HC919_05290 [Oscillatoriales cyanobacterium SM2_2_1]|nr:hypothetical protein [Oscillatoriales cyanobacterium SM2_2_1]